MHIGLIGGIGPAATDFYHRRLICLYAKLKAPLELTIVHADTPTLISNLARNDAAAQAPIFARLTQRLAAAGADLVAVTSVAGHFCRTEFRALSVLPAVDMIAEVDRFVSARGLKRVGILGTRTVMESRFYGSLTQAEVIPPLDEDLGEVHQAYVTTAAAGAVTEAQRAVFYSAARRLIEEKGAEAIMLGGTDLALVFDEHNSPFPLVDCAAIHTDAIVESALGSKSKLSTGETG
jgi:aspartate racemase